jgi:photosystem II stability/assembly factor-like uncharacterized protein
MQSLSACLCIVAASVLLASEAAAQEDVHWEHRGWGAGGFYWAAAFHPAEDGAIYMGGDVAGVYKTEDAGLQWRLINNGLADYAVYALAVDPGNPDTVYAGTVSGLCRSTDAGEHWTFLPETGRGRLRITSERNVSVRNIAVDPTNGQIVYAGTPDGRVLKSADQGDTWTEVHRAGGAVATVLVQADGRTVFAATASDGLLESDDAGTTWRSLPTPKKAMSVAASGEVLYGAFDRDGVWKSTDGGETWSATGEGIREGVLVRDVAAAPDDPDRVSCIGNRGWDGFFYRSEDGGATWELSNRLKRSESDPTLPEEFSWIPDNMCGLSRPANLALNPRDPDEMLIAANWRVVYSDDGGRTWEQRDRGADITCAHDIRFHDGRTYVTAMDEGLLMSPDNGQTWQQLAPLKYEPPISGHQWRVRIIPRGDSFRIVSTCSPWAEQRNKVLISDDGGETFRVVTDGLPDYRPRANTMWGESYPRALAVDPSDPNTLYLGMDGAAEPDQGRPGGGVFKSTDGGDTWQRLPGQPGSRRMFYGLVVDPTDPQRLFWGASAENGGLWRTDDEGQSWSRVMDRETWVFNVAVTPSGTVYCPGKQLWKSTDHGGTWQKISDLPGDIQIVGLAVDPEDEDRIWLSRVTWGSGAVGGIFETTDGGVTWTEITGDIPYVKPLVLRYDPDTHELWAGGVGLFAAKR